MRTREKIMREWDDIRASIAGGCTNSGPRDWLEGVLDEHDHDIARLERALKLIASGMVGDRVLSELELSGIASAALEAEKAFWHGERREFALGQRVRKTKGSSWHGRVVGFYSTSLTPIGYAIESDREPGSVQIYPETALEAVDSHG